MRRGFTYTKNIKLITYFFCDENTDLCCTDIDCSYYTFFYQTCHDFPHIFLYTTMCLAKRISATQALFLFLLFLSCSLIFFFMAEAFVELIGVLHCWAHLFH